MRASLHLFTLLLLCALRADAVPPTLNYAGQVAVNGQAFEGQGLFKFALVNPEGNASYWSNDGTSAGGSEPQNSVSVAVNGGLYSILLGNSAIPGMSALDPSIFQQHPNLRLRVWFNDGVNGFQQLSPDRPFASVPYALTAGDVSDSSISLNRLSPEVLGALKILPSISTQPFARYDRSNGSAQMEVSARGHNLSYQWLKNGQSLNGSNTPILQITNAVLDGNDTYAVRISNSLGQTTSLPVLLQDAIGAPGPELEEANATQVPTDGLVLWLDAQDTDGNGVADNLPEGTKVQIWYDRSGNENHLLQPEENLAPAISTNGNRQSLHFLLSEKMRLDQNFTLATVFMVMKVPESLKTSDAVLLNVSHASLRKSSKRSMFTTNEGNIMFHGDSLLTNGIFPNGAIFYNQNAVYYGTCNRFLEWIELANSWSGQIHEIIFYERYLSESENASVTAYLKHKWQVPENIQTNSVDGMIAHYKFEPNETGKIIYDSSGNNHHVLLIGPLDEAPLISGLDGSALALPGDDANYLKLPSYESPMKTIALWLKPNFSIQAGSSPFALFHCGNLEGLIFNESSTKLSNESIALGHFTENASSRHSATTTQIPNGWIHLTLAWSEESGYYEYFLNGQPISTLAGMHGHFDLLTGANIQFGKKVFTNQHGETAAYSGAIDELRIYEIALTAPEVLFLHNQVRAPFIRTAGEYNATIGGGFSLNIQVEKEVNLFRAEGLPAGLSLNVVTGEISGVPLIPGYHRVYLTAANEHGKTAGLISIHTRAEMDSANWPVDIPDGSDIPQNGLVLWLDANDVDADGEFDTGTDHLKLANWADKAGKDHNATQATVTNQPKIRSGQIAEKNTLKLIHFDGNQSMYFPIIQEGRTFFWVVNRNSENHRFANFIGYEHSDENWNWGRNLDGAIFEHAFDNIKLGLQKRNGEILDLTIAGTFLLTPQIISLRTTDFVASNSLGKRANYETFDFQGNIGETLIYDRALSTSEIETVEAYLASKWAISLTGDSVQDDLSKGLIAHLPFDESTGIVARDISGNNINANLVGYDSENANWVSGKIGGALSLDGVNDWGTIPVSLDNNFTIGIWLKTSYMVGRSLAYQNDQDFTDYQGIFSGKSRSYALILNYGKFNYWMGSSGNTWSDPRLTSSGVVSVGNWMHVVATRSGSNDNGKFKMYVNGNFETSTNFNQSVNYGSNSYIGRTFNSDKYLPGDLDDLRIYDRVLSDTEIQALYNLGSNPLASTTYASPNPSFTLTPATNSVTTAHLTEQILKYLKPEITTHPQPSNVYSDSNHTFSVTAEGKYLTYQWKKNGADLPGETNATLVLPDANSTLHDGNYSVVVSNDFGKVESGMIEFLVPSFTITKFPSLQLWLDSSDPSTITLNNGKVSSWHDKSTLENNASQPVEAKQPVFGQDENGTYVQFTSSYVSGEARNVSANNFLNISAISGKSIFFVVDHDGTKTSFVVGSEDNYKGYIFIGGNSYAISIDGYATEPGPLDIGTWWYNGSFQATGDDLGTLGQISLNTPSLHSIIYQTDDPMFPFHRLGSFEDNKGGFGGKMREIISFDEYLSAASRLEIEGYLAHKWGLTGELPTDHPYKNDAP